MTNHSRKENLIENDIVDTLLQLPVRNLESRISQLEAEIRNRKRLRDEFLSTLGTQQLNLEERAWQLRYAGFTDRGMEHLRVIESEIRKIGQMKVTEKVFSFRDVAQIQEKLQTARDEFEQELVKLKLVGSQPSTSSGKYLLNHKNDDKKKDSTTI